MANYTNLVNEMYKEAKFENPIKGVIEHAIWKAKPGIPHHEGSNEKLGTLIVKEVDLENKAITFCNGESKNG